MKPIIFFLLLTHSAIRGYSQINEFEMYYPQNPLFKKLGVKSVLDTSGSIAGNYYLEQYDTLGRQISSGSVKDSVTIRFRYARTGDTLVKYHYKSGKIDDEVYRYESFVYNKKGRIVLYQDCRRKYRNNTAPSACSVDRFFYDDKNRLVSKLMYTNSNYPAPFSPALQLNKSLLNLVDVYAYTYDKNGNIETKRQMTGKPEYRTIDSFYYNKANKPIKIVSRQAQGFLGEWAVGELCRTTLFRYETNRATDTSWLNYSDWEIHKTKTTDKQTNEYIFYPNGLVNTRHQKHDSYIPNERFCRYVYEFYKPKAHK